MGLSAESTIRLLNNLMAQSPIPFAILDGPQHAFAVCNQAYEKLAARKVVFGKTVEELFPEIKDQGFIAILDKVYETGVQYQAHNILVKLQGPDGSLEDHYLDFTYSPFRDLNRDIKGIVVIATDVTANNALRAERERLKSYIAQTPVAIAILKGPELRFDLMNPMYSDFVGNRELLGLTVREAFPEIANQGFYEILDQVFQTGVPFAAREARVFLRRSKEGEPEETFQDFTYQPFRGTDGTVEGIIVTVVDATERVRARETIENQQLWLEAVLNRLPVALVMANPGTGEYLFVNDQARQLFGMVMKTESDHMRNYKPYFEVEDLQGRRLKPEEFPSARAARGEILNNEQVIFRTPEGQRFLNVNSAMIPAMYGHAETAIVPFQDITDLKSKEAQLNDSEMRLSSALIASRIGFWEWNIVDNLVHGSTHMLSDWGFAQDQSTQPFDDVFARILGEDQPRVWDALLASQKNEHQAYDIEFRIRPRPESLLWIHAKGRVYFNANGQPIRMTGTSVDVTARKRAEEVVRESERQFRMLADSMPQIVWAADPDGTMIYTNQRGFEYTGSLDPGEWLNFVHIEDREQALSRWTASLKSGERYDTEFRLLRKSDQTYRWHLVRANPVTDDHGRTVRWYGTCTDVTAQKELQIDLAHAKEQAESANNLKTAFLANMSHEIRTPLGAILGFTELVKGSDLGKDQRDHLNVISRNGHALTRLIDDILDISKVEAGKLMLEFVPFSFHALLHEVVEMFGESVRAKSISLSIENETPVPDRLISDPSRLRQILVNIIGNAVKFTSHGGIRVRLRAENLGANRIELSVLVIDTGTGLTPEQASKLFQPFTQADNSVRRKFGGTGLGLVLSRKLAEGLGGTVEFKEGYATTGAAFEIRIRAAFDQTAPSHDPEKPKTSSGTKATSKKLEGIRVLAVDDTADNRNLIRHFLTRESAVVDEAENGDQAVEMALRNDYDIILMDIQMPGSDGYSALKSLRAKNYRPPVIALTAHAMLEERRRTEEAGFHAHLTKPIDPKHLVDVILKSTRDSRP